MNIISTGLIGGHRGATTFINRFLALKDLKKATPGGNTLPKVHVVVLERFRGFFGNIAAKIVDTVSIK